MVGRNGTANGTGRAPLVVNIGRMFDREPPHSPEAEAALLGALIIDHTATDEVAEILAGPDAFYAPAHAALYAALMRQHEKGKPADIVLLGNALEAAGTLDDVGGREYILRLASGTPGVAAAPYYARIVAEKHRLRRLIQAAGTIAHEAYHAHDDDSAEVVDAAEQRIFDIAREERAGTEGDLPAMVEAEWNRLQTGTVARGILTHYHDLDDLTGGLHPGNLVIVAGRPSMGKSAMGLGLALNIGIGGPGERADKVPVGVFSMEDDRQAVTRRLLAMAAGVDLHKMRSGRCDGDEMADLGRACQRLQSVPMYVDDGAGLTVTSLRARARRMVARHGVRVIVVDYLQLMTAPGRAESRQVEVSAISRGLKAMARELSVPVVCLSQLNRGPENRADNRPRMSDLRESGSIEQDADVVMLLHREEYYHLGDEEWKAANEDKLGVAEVIVAKQRNGPTDTVRLTWDAATTRFKNFSARRV